MQPDSQRHASGYALARLQANGQERTRQPFLLSHEVAQARQWSNSRIVTPTLNEAGNVGTFLRQLCSFKTDGLDSESQRLGPAALAGLEVAEAPSIEMPRLAGHSHLNARREGTRILRGMPSARFAPRTGRCAVALRPLAPSD
jgi:hypothetical protein